MKLYMAQSGYYYTNWEISNHKAFKTKKALVSYMNDIHSAKFTKNRSSLYKGEDHYEDNDLGYGFNIISIEYIDK